MMKNIKLFLIVIFLLNSCASMKEAGQVLRNEKIKTSDEFLIQKKQPLVLPPDYNKIPEPGTQKDLQVGNKEKIKKILKASEEETSSENKSTSIENSIIEKIRK